jgi:phosphopantetheinyl transferase
VAPVVAPGRALSRSERPGAKRKRHAQRRFRRLAHKLIQRGATSQSLGLSIGQFVLHPQQFQLGTLHLHGWHVA